jgi:HNH endonuclease
MSIIVLPDSEPVAPQTSWWVDRERAREIAGRLNVAHGELVDLVATVIAAKTWSGDGIRSPEHWLMLNAGLSPAHAREVVRIADRRPDLPTAAVLQRSGQLSLDQADALTKHAPADHEASAARSAAKMTVPQIRQVMGRYVFDQPKPDHRSAWERAENPPELQMVTEFGRFHLRFDAPLDVGALVRQAVLEAKDALFQLGRPHAGQADGLIEMATRSLRVGREAANGAESRAESRQKNWRIYVHLGTDGAWLAGGQLLPDHLIRKLTCDGVLQPVWQTDGVPVNVGRAMRIVPDRTRRLIVDRDRGCRYPGCPVGVVPYLEVHHLDHWLDGGRTDLDRMLCLCPHHHDRHHAGDFAMTGTPMTPDGVRFTGASGREIRLARPRVPAQAGTRAGPRYHGSIGETIDHDFFTINRNRGPGP